MKLLLMMDKLMCKDWLVNSVQALNYIQTIYLYPLQEN